MIQVLKPTKLVCHIRLQSHTQTHTNQSTKYPIPRSNAYDFMPPSHPILHSCPSSPPPFCRCCACASQATPRRGSMRAIPHAHPPHIRTRPSERLQRGSGPVDPMSHSASHSGPAPLTGGGRGRCCNDRRPCAPLRVRAAPLSNRLCGPGCDSARQSLLGCASTAGRSLINCPQDRPAPGQAGARARGRLYQ